MKKIIDFVREQEERIRNERPLSKSEILELWHNLGFTQGLEKNKGLEWKVAKSLHNVYEFCNKTFTGLNSDARSNAFEVIVLPLTRRVHTRQGYDGHILEGDELFMFMDSKKTDDILVFLESVRKGYYTPSKQEGRLASIDFAIVIETLFELYSIKGLSLYDAISCEENFTKLTDKEKRILKDVINLDFEAELTALIAEYFVYFNRKGNKTPENIKEK